MPNLRIARDTELDKRRFMDLFTMLETRRPVGGRTETKFVCRWVLTLPGAFEDSAYNVHVIVPRKDGTASNVIWSCHTDTVHRTEGTQALFVTSRLIRLDFPKDNPSNCLGADDTVGVWLCREMILAGVPGHYVFHYGEESGGIGSSAIVEDEPELFTDACYAIAFDRRGYRDIITHQSGGRCCSDAFARSLARELRPVARYRPSDRGIYTDTAEYTGIVAECTNVSVGYSAEHTCMESVDYWHALALCRVLTTTFDESRLVCSRIPEPRFRFSSASWDTSKDWDTYGPIETWDDRDPRNGNLWDNPRDYTNPRLYDKYGDWKRKLKPAAPAPALYLPGTFGPEEELTEEDRLAIQKLIEFDR